MNPFREPLTDDEREEIARERADHWQDTKVDREAESNAETDNFYD